MPITNESDKHRLIHRIPYIEGRAEKRARARKAYLQLSPMGRMLFPVRWLWATVTNGAVAKWVKSWFAKA